MDLGKLASFSFDSSTFFDSSMSGTPEATVEITAAYASSYAFSSVEFFASSDSGPATATINIADGANDAILNMEIGDRAERSIDFYLNTDIADLDTSSIEIDDNVTFYFNNVQTEL